MRRAWRVSVSHVYREGNQCTDWLATYALTLGNGMHVMQEPPAELGHYLREDVGGVGRPRRCSRLSGMG
ncbi:hypothetical protein K1719_002327 [Acacia pycnantha]|nr:hypothetical protein K1719_002327 [Acacia pycnantha]